MKVAFAGTFTRIEATQAFGASPSVGGRAKALPTLTPGRLKKACASAGAPVLSKELFGAMPPPVARSPSAQKAGRSKQ